MLVLSRKNGQSVQIDKCIEVTVLEISGGKVKLGFSAPREVSIQRNEIRREYPNACLAWDRPPIAGELCTA
jgi:carbon storage regulator